MWRTARLAIFVQNTSRRWNIFNKQFTTLANLSSYILPRILLDYMTANPPLQNRPNALQCPLLLFLILLGRQWTWCHLTLEKGCWGLTSLLYVIYFDPNSNIEWPMELSRRCWIHVWLLGMRVKDVDSIATSSKAVQKSISWSRSPKDVLDTISRRRSL